MVCISFLCDQRHDDVSVAWAVNDSKKVHVQSSPGGKPLRVLETCRQVLVCGESDT